MNEVTIIKRLIIITIFILTAVSCIEAPGYTYPTPTGQNGAAAVSTASALLAQATSEANIATATSAQATALAGQATAEAIASATSEASATAQAVITTGTAAAVATGQSLEVIQTVASIDATSTYTAFQIGAEATREAIAQDALITEAQDYRQALNIELTRQALEVNRQALINQAIPWLYAGGALLFVFVLAIVFLIVHRRLNPKVIGGAYPFQNMDQGRILPPAGPLIITDGLSGVLSIPGRVTGPSEPIALPEPEAAVTLADRFDLGHYLIAGETRAGKGTLARYILDRMDQAQILAADPHFKAGNWPGASQVFGAGRNFGEIDQLLKGYMMAELNQRAKDLAADPSAVWPPVMVIIDEAPAIRRELGPTAAHTWAAWLREGWKFDLYLMLLTQSTRVKSLGIEGEGDLLRNFANRFALGDVALKEFPNVANHLQRPAVILGRHGPKPVIIPHIPDNRGPAGQEGGVSNPTYTAPIPLGGGAGVSTSKGHVSEAEAVSIMNLHQKGVSLRAIEREVFHTEKGQEGGANFYKIKEVISQRGATATPPTISQVIR